MSTVQKNPAPTAISAREWVVPALLVLLSAVPVLAGAFRVGELAVDAPVTPENARFFAAPVPVVLHILAASPYCVLGAFQFVPRLRRRRWHRVSGRLLVPLGAVGAAMAAFIVAGFLAVRRRDFARHSAWMIRAYALGQGAGTQVLTHLPWMLAGAEFDQPTRALAMGAGWAVNVVVAEWAIRRMRGRSPRSARSAGPP